MKIKEKNEENLSSQKIKKSSNERIDLSDKENKDGIIVTKGKELEDKFIEIDNALKESNGYYFKKNQCEAKENTSSNILKNVVDYAK